MTGIYDLFLARVAEGRNIPVERVAASAEGRIFSGRDGKARGLVDELGGLAEAIGTGAHARGPAGRRARRRGGRERGPARRAGRGRAAGARAGRSWSAHWAPAGRPSFS